MESLKDLLSTIIVLVLIFALPVLAVLTYRLIKNKICAVKNKDQSHSEIHVNGTSEILDHNNSIIKPLEKDVDRIDPKYYKWLICSTIGSFLLFGGFVYAKGNGLVSIVAEWLLSSLVNGVFLSLIVAGITRAMKRNYKNAFLGTFAIMVFISACIAIAKISIALK